MFWEETKTVKAEPSFKDQSFKGRKDEKLNEAYSRDSGDVIQTRRGLNCMFSIGNGAKACVTRL